MNNILFIDHSYLTILIRKDLSTGTSTRTEVHWHWYVHQWCIFIFDLTCLIGKWKAISPGFIYLINIYGKYAMNWVLLMYFSYLRGAQEILMNEWMSEWPSHRCISWMQLQRPLRKRDLSVLSTQLIPNQKASYSHLGLQSPWLSLSPVSLLGFQPRNLQRSSH